MKRYFFYGLMSILILCSQQVFGQEEKSRPLVVIDPGHGGADCGAIGINGLKEKEVVLKLAKEVVRLNGQLFNDTLDIYLTRYNDTFISLKDRSKLSRAFSADVFVSVHCNQANIKSAQGVEFYIEQTEKQSSVLAEMFAAGFIDKLGLKNRGVRHGDFQVLRETRACPGVLLELGFLSNWAEAEHNRKRASISGYALLILETLINFLNYD